MKRLIVLLMIIVISVSISFAVNITIKGVSFTVSFSKVEANNLSGYRIKLLDGSDLDGQELVIKKIKQELFKYPKNVLIKYVPKRINVVCSLYNIKTNTILDGIWYGKGIILTYSVFDSVNDSDLRVIHHEIFHSMYAKGQEESCKLLKRLDTFCKYSTNYNLETIDVSTFKSQFLSLYHPNGLEVACDTFSFLMYNDFKHNSAVIDWYVSEKSKSNYYLKENIKAVINFTSKISNSIMDTNYYYDIINR